MGKKNQNNTRASIEQVDAELAKLDAQRAKLMADREAANRARVEEISAQIDSFPALLGVATLGEVASLIRQREKGTLGSVAQDVTRRARTVLSKEQIAQLVEDRRASLAAGRGIQYSALGEKYGVSDQTAFNHCKAAGLVNERSEAPAAAPAEAPAVAAS